LSIRRSQIAIIVLLIANLAGCGFMAYGAAIFCTAPSGTLDWFTIPYSLLLVVIFPLLFTGLFWDRFRMIAVAAGMLCLVGLAAQQMLLDEQVLHCDVP